MDLRNVLQSAKNLLIGNLTLFDDLIEVFECKVKLTSH
jgi:hypothetical protein